MTLQDWVGWNVNFGLHLGTHVVLNKPEVL